MQNSIETCGNLCTELGPLVVVSAVAKTKLRHVVNYHCTDPDIKLAFSTLLLGIFSTWKIPWLRASDRGWFVSFFVLAVMPVTLAKLLATSPLVSVNTLYRTRLLMSTNKLLHLKLAGSPVPWNVSLSMIPPPLGFQLKTIRTRYI